MEKKGLYNERSGAILILIGLAIFVIAAIVMNPLGEGLGVSESPGRIALLYIFAVAFCLPFAAYLMYLPGWANQSGLWANRYMK